MKNKINQSKELDVGKCVSFKEGNYEYQICRTDVDEYSLIQNGKLVMVVKDES